VKTARIALLLVIAFASHLLAQSKEDKSVQRRPVSVIWDLRIPMRDGVHLSGTVYRAADQKEPLPVIVTMTPYIAAHAAKQGNYFAQNGYVFVAVDDRGRGNSEGVFVPGEVEGKDGYDAVEFLARQPWCNGEVVTWGGSWLGFTQWSLAKEFPPHLKAIAPTASVYPGIDYPNPGGIFMSYTLGWLAYVNGRAGNDGLFNESTFWGNAYWSNYSAGRSFADLDTTSGITNTVFRKWLAHPNPDAFWDAMTPSTEQFKRINIPILTITGHYDADQLGALTYYRRHMQYGPPEVTRRHELVIGPYDHSGTRRPKEEVAGFKVGAAAVLDMEKLHREWFDYVLKGKPRPEFLKDRVMYYVTGENAWHSAPSLDSLLANSTPLYLGADGVDGHDLFKAGALTRTPPATNSELHITIDPAKPLDRDAHEEIVKDPNEMLNQRSAYAVSDGDIYFHSEPFAADTEMAGIPGLRLWIASNVPDADLLAELYEVRADGTSVFLSSGQLRLRYRDDLRKPVLLPIDVPVEVELANFSFFAQRISKKSRLRLHVAFVSGPSWERNPNTGDVVASADVHKARAATLRILTDPQHASVLRVPISPPK
jgi:putative CocE/NonD family hydrolase